MIRIALKPLFAMAALALLAGCASTSSYRDGYYYPSQHGQGDYYSAPAERYPYGGPYHGPYYGPYYGGFHHYPFYPYRHGFYGRFHHYPYRHHRQSFGIGIGIGHGYHGPSHGYAPYYGYGGGFGLYRLHHRNDRHPPRARHEDERPQAAPAPIRVMNRPQDAGQPVQRARIDKRDPDLRIPMGQPFRTAAPNGPITAPRADDARAVRPGITYRPPSGSSAPASAKPAPVRVRSPEPSPRIAQPRLIESEVVGPGMRASKQRQQPPVDRRPTATTAMPGAPHRGVSAAAPTNVGVAVVSHSPPATRASVSPGKAPARSAARSGDTPAQAPTVTAREQ